MVQVHAQRTYDSPVQWLLWIDTGLPTMSCGRLRSSGHIFARAVVDDFGNLVIVREWM